MPNYLSQTIYPVFIFDEAFIFEKDKDNAGKKRLQFLMDALNDLRNSLEKVSFINKFSSAIMITVDFIYLDF